MGAVVAQAGRPRPILALALALGLSIAPGIGVATGVAQDDGAEGSRRWVYALVGAAVGAIPAYVFTEGRSIGSNCSDRACVTLAAGMIGAGVGFLIGRDLDVRHGRRMAAGPSIDYNYRNIALGLTPDLITSFPGGAAIVGLGGARVVLEDGTVWRRGEGVRGIEDVAVIPGLDLLVLSTTANLLSFPVYGDAAQGQVIGEQGGAAMEVFQEDLAVAGLDTLRMLRLRREGGDVAIETLAGLEQREFVSDMAYSPYTRVGWLLIQDRLEAYSTDLEKVGELELPAAGRTVRARGGRVVVAAGSHGVYVIDARDPGRPQMVQQFTGVRFAYAADIAGDDLYVAAGPEGCVVVDIAGEEPRVRGVARELRMATDVAAVDDEIWILDRDGQQLQIATFEPVGGESGR
jgi:hypothetical protein